MSLNNDAQKIRAKQVGVLMRHYRSSFPAEDGRTGLTLENVLERMAKANQRYETSAPSTVSRWESGATMPKKRRLQEFGAALNLSPHEIDGLLALAGIDTENRPEAAHSVGTAQERHEDVAASLAGSGRLIPESGGTLGQSSVRSSLAQALNGGILRFLLPALAIAGGGYLLSSLGITETWMLMLYIGLTMGLVVSQGLFKMRRAGNLRELLFVTLFIVLSTGLLQVPFIGMDPYGFYIWGEPGRDRVAHLAVFDGQPGGFAYGQSDVRPIVAVAILRAWRRQSVYEVPVGGGTSNGVYLLVGPANG